jgi:DNA-binding LytR/AlgR family response regulator
MKLNCIIIEDEMPAMELMVDNVQKIPYLSLLGCCKNTFEAGELLLLGNVDLIFSDIEIPVVSGIQFIKSLQNPPLIILTTAYEQYAVEGYELEVIDYLLKPFSFDRFLKAVTKAQHQYKLRNGHILNSLAEEYIFVYSEYKELKIALGDIIYIEGLKDYVKIYLENQRHPLLTRLNLKGIEAKLPKTVFCRVHNSYIVPLAKITSIQKTKVYLGNTTIPVGAYYSEHFVEVYKSTPS